MKKLQPQTISFLISVFFGVAAGMVGALLVAAYILPPVVVDITSGRSGRVVIDEETAVGDTVRATSAVAHLYIGEPHSTEAGDIFVSDNRIGLSTILTSDGWLVTARDVLPKLTSGAMNAAEVTVVFRNGESAKITKLVDVPELDLVFVKTDARDLRVSVFGESRVLVPGEIVYLPTETTTGLVSVRVIDPSFRSGVPHEPESTSDFRRQILVEDSLPGTIVGAPLLTRGGEMVGLLTGKVDEADTQLQVSAALPVEILRNALSRVLSTGEVGFTDIGVNGLPVHVASVLPEGVTSREGWMVTFVGEKSDLRIGDLIRAVGSDVISERLPFSEILMTYSEDATLEFTVLRNGEEMRIVVPLTQGP